MLLDKLIKNTYIHTSKYYSSIKKIKIMPFAAKWLDLEIILIEESWKEKDKYHMIILRMWKLIKKKIIQMTLFRKQK